MLVSKVQDLKVDTKDNSFHSLVKPSLMVCRLFGMFPVTNILATSYKKLRFKVKSPYLIYCLGTLCGHVVLASFGFAYIFVGGHSPRNYFKALVNTLGLLLNVSVLCLAKRWSIVLRKVAEIENSLPKFPTKKKLKLICNCAIFISFFWGLVDFALYVMFYIQMGDACVQSNSTGESLYKYTMPWAAHFIPYSLWKVGALLILQVQSVIVMNFADIIIMVASLYLANLFQELNEIIFLYQNKYPHIWHVIRKHYTQLTHLVDIIDDNVSSFVLLSFGGNLALICVNLFKVLRKDAAHSTEGCDLVKIEAILEGPVRAAYFAFTVIFQIVRVLVTALLASRVHTLSRRSIPLIYEIPTVSYSSEAHRFLEQMSESYIALSGMQFFYITRNMILHMAATIATYELVLLQFSGKDEPGH